MNNFSFRNNKNRQHEMSNLIANILTKRKNMIDARNLYIKEQIHKNIKEQVKEEGKEEVKEEGKEAVKINGITLKITPITTENTTETLEDKKIITHNSSFVNFKSSIKLR